eukprot:1182884-Prorocentrum_minimum.AAC.1
MRKAIRVPMQQPANMLKQAGAPLGGVWCGSAPSRGEGTPIAIALTPNHQQRSLHLKSVVGIWRELTGRFNLRANGATDSLCCATVSRSPLTGRYKKETVSRAEVYWDYPFSVLRNCIAFATHRKVKEGLLVGDGEPGGGLLGLPIHCAARLYRVRHSPEATPPARAGSAPPGQQTAANKPPPPPLRWPRPLQHGQPHTPTTELIGRLCTGSTAQIRTNQTQYVWVYSHGGPIRRGSQHTENPGVPEPTSCRTGLASRIWSARRGSRRPPRDRMGGIGGAFLGA